MFYRDEVLGQGTSTNLCGETIVPALPRLLLMRAGVVHMGLCQVWAFSKKEVR